MRNCFCQRLHGTSELPGRPSSAFYQIKHIYIEYHDQEEVVYILRVRELLNGNTKVRQPKAPVVCRKYILHTVVVYSSVHAMPPTLLRL